MTEPEQIAAVSNEPVAWLSSNKRNDEVIARTHCINLNPRYWTETPLYAHPPVDPEGPAPAGARPPGALYSHGQWLTKRSGASWTGLVVGFYSTSLTPIGYCIESDAETGSVQIYPERALKAVHKGAPL